MSADSEPGSHDGLHRNSKRPQYQNTINLGQIGTILAIVTFFGGGLLYQRTETEAIRKDHAVLKVQTEALASNVTEDKVRSQRENADQKQALNQNLTKIEGKVDAVTVVVQQLSTQIAISQGLQNQPPRRP